MSKNKNKKKKPFGFVVAAGLVALAAWLLSQFPGLGLGLGLGNNNNNGDGEVNATVEETNKSSEAASTEETTKPEQTKETEETEVSSIEVIVKGDVITVNGEELKEEKAIKDSILAVYKDGLSISLKDEQAVKASYDLAKKVLDELGYEYSETK